MLKPTVFFSHSSKDQAALARLKASYVSKTGGSVEVFLSSDGQSIPLGKNWVHTVEEALDKASLMVVFVTPTSLRSSWLYFESGFAYSKKLRVVPVGFLGADLSTVPPPLSLLQGFNILSEGGLNNLIAVTNDVFHHAHSESFTPEDFNTICGAVNGIQSQSFGSSAEVVDQVRFFLQVDQDFAGPPESLLDKAHEIFKQIGVDCQRHENRLDAQGLSMVSQTGNGPDQVTVNIEGSAADFALPLAARALRDTCLGGLAGRTIVIDFVSQVRFVDAHHKRSGKLLGTGVTLAPAERLQYRDLNFTIGRRRNTRSFVNGPAYLEATLGKNELLLDQLRELIALLLDRHVVYIGAAFEAA